MRWLVDATCGSGGRGGQRLTSQVGFMGAPLLDAVDCSPENTFERPKSDSLQCQSHSTSRLGVLTAHQGALCTPTGS